jgi:transposase
VIRNPKLAKRISDVAWSEFCRQLSYKAKWCGRTYHRIDRWFASSQTCSECGFKNESIKLLSIRELFQSIEEEDRVFFSKSRGNVGLKRKEADVIAKTIMINISK